MEINYRQRGFILVELPVARKRAFTLIELLVVIAIIGVLATVIILNIGKAGAKSRDAKRKDDISQIARALKMYHAEKGSYPTNVGGPGGVQTLDYSYRTGGSNWMWLNNSVSLQPYLALPKDPKNNNINSLLGYNYWYRLGRTSATLPAGTYDWFSVYVRNLENTSDRDACGNGRVFALVVNNGTYTSCSFNSAYRNTFGITSNGK